MSKRWVASFAAGALIMFILSLAGCATEFKDPVPDQPTPPETASWSGADTGGTP